MSSDNNLMTGSIIDLGETQPPRPNFLTGTTESITIINSGADNKFDIVISVSDAGGGFRAYQVASQLPKGQSTKVDLHGLDKKFIRVFLSSRDINNIGRYITTLEARSGYYFKDLKCWWQASPSDPRLEEHFFFGTEVPL